jgi:hypothetical protein
MLFEFNERIILLPWFHFQLQLLKTLWGPFAFYSSAVGFTVCSMNKTSTCAACWDLLLFFFGMENMA